MSPLQVVAVKFTQVIGACPCRDVDTRRLKCNLFEQIPIQFAPDLFSLVFDERFSVPLLRDPRSSFRISQPNREDRHISLFGDCRRIEWIRLLIVPIGNQYHGLITVCIGMEHFQPFANGIADRSSTAWSTVGIEFFERASKGVIIDGEGTLDDRLSSKGN